VRQLLGDIQRLLVVLLGYASCFVKQVEDRLSCVVEAVAWNKRDYGIFCHVHTSMFRTRRRFDQQNNEKGNQIAHSI
jgi:hypothetical protein